VSEIGCSIEKNPYKFQSHLNISPIFNPPWESGSAVACPPEATESIVLSRFVDFAVAFTEFFYFIFLYEDGFFFVTHGAIEKVEKH
jgi:hypothetical protein